MNEGTRWRRTLVEGLAIVLSILFAFAIDAWWDRLGERDEERESLQVVAVDLSTSLEQLTEYAEYVDRYTEASLQAYKALSTETPEEERERVSDLLVTSTRRRTLSLPRTGYVDLVSTGGLRLIQDRELRNEVIQFYELADRLEQVVEKNSAIHTDGHLADILIRDGLVLKRPVDPSNRVVFDGVREQLGAGFQHRPDPIWSFSSDSREWDRVRSALLLNGRGLLTSAALARRLMSAAADLRESIVAYLGDSAP